jgi:hypothetical protein
MSKPARRQRCWRLKIEPSPDGYGYAFMLYKPGERSYFFGVWAARPTLGHLECSAWLRKHLHLSPNHALPLEIER